MRITFEAKTHLQVLQQFPPRNSLLPPLFPGYWILSTSRQAQAGGSGSSAIISLLDCGGKKITLLQTFRVRIPPGGGGAHTWEAE